MEENSVLDGVENQPARELRLIFAGSSCFGVFADEIEAIVDWRTPTPLPAAPASVLGVVCIRGRMLTVLEVAALPGDGAAAGRSKLVALRGDEQLALAVARTGDLIKIAPDEWKAASDAGSLTLGVISQGEQSIPVLNCKELFAAAMRGRERRRRGF